MLFPAFREKRNAERRHPLHDGQKRSLSATHSHTDLSFRPRQIDDRNANTTPLLKPNYCINLRSLHPRQKSTLALSRATERLVRRPPFPPTAAAPLSRIFRGGLLIAAPAEGVCWIAVPSALARAMRPEIALAAEPRRGLGLTAAAAPNRWRREDALDCGIRALLRLL